MWRNLYLTSLTACAFLCFSSSFSESHALLAIQWNDAIAYDAYHDDFLASVDGLSASEKKEKAALQADDDYSFFFDDDLVEFAENCLDHPQVVAPQNQKNEKGLPVVYDLTQYQQQPQDIINEEPKYVPQCPQALDGYTVNFEDISVIQLIQFISRISGINYIFDSTDLQFNITIVSEDSTSIENLSAILLQVLKMHGLSVVEQGRNVLIYKNENLSRVSTVITEDNLQDSCDSAIVTRVFSIYNVHPEKITTIIKPLLSRDAVVEVSSETGHLVVSDITANVTKIAELLRALETPTTTFEIGEYTVKNGSPAALVAFAYEILAPLAPVREALKMIPQPAAQKIFIVSTPFLIQKTLEVLASLDSEEIANYTPEAPVGFMSLEQSNFKMYKLRYHDGRDIAAAIHEIAGNLQYAGIANPDFLNTVQSVQWVATNNSLILTGTNASIDKVIALVKELDAAPKQVYIEVLIIDTTLKNAIDFGVQWIALGDEQDKLAYASGLLSNPITSGTSSTILAGSPTATPGARFVAANPAANPPLIPNAGRDVSLPSPPSLQGFTDLVDQTAAFGLGIIGNIIRHNGQSFLTLGALLSALDEESYTEIVLNPKIMVEDNQPADFFVGQNIPYQTTSTVIQQTGSVTQNIQYEDIGVHLRVLPTISPNNIVTLQIDQTVAENLTPASLTPTTSKILASTRVHVPDGTFLVMSGQVRDESVLIHSGIPCLGSLPCIGAMFSRTIDRRQKRNLIMFIRPKVVSTIQEGIDLTNEEGYEYNWQSDPCSLLDCAPILAPECEVYPILPNPECEEFLPPPIIVEPGYGEPPPYAEPRMNVDPYAESQIYMEPYAEPPTYMEPTPPPPYDGYFPPSPYFP